jgi:hypothetical protein
MEDEKLSALFHFAFLLFNVELYDGFALPSKL